MRAILCDAAANSNRLRCPAGTDDFAPGQGIRIRGAGAATPLTAAGSFGLRINGAAGNTSYIYAACTADPWRGIAGCGRGSINYGPAALTLANNITVAIPRGGQPLGALLVVYRKVGSGPWRFVTVIPPRPFNDIGWTPAGSDGWPSSPPWRVTNQDWWSTVRGLGTTSITLADNVPSSVRNTTVMHDDTLAIQAAIYAGARAGRAVKFGPHTYPVNLPSVYSTASGRFSFTFTKSTYGYPLQGLLQLRSGSKLLGSGARFTTLATDLMGHPSGQTATFGLNTGHHSNPFWLRDLTTCRLKPAPAGATVVAATSPSEAGYFSPGDYVAVYGGTGLPPPYVSNELTRVIRSDPAAGNLAIEDRLEKPLPLGAPGTPPSLARLTGEIVHDISISGLTIDNYSAAFINTSAVMHIHMANIDAPLYSNSDFWWGGFRRDWTMDNLDIVSQREEFDLDEDVHFRGGSWLLYGDGMTVSEGSSTILWTDSHLTYNELFCSRPQCGPDKPAGSIGAQLSVTNWRVIHDVISVKQALSNAVEGNWTLVQQAGALPGYTAHGTVIRGNTIRTNARFGVVFAGPVLGADIRDNQLYMTLTAGLPIRAVQLYGGDLVNNLIQITAPPVRSNTEPLVNILPVMRAPLPTRIADNRIRVLNGPNYVHIAVAGGSFTEPVTIANNICENSTYCVHAAAPPAHLKNLSIAGNIANHAAIAPLYRGR